MRAAIVLRVVLDAVCDDPGVPGRRSRRSPRRLSTQILLLQVLVLCGALAVGFLLAVLDARSRLDEEFEQRALAVARSVAATPEVAREVVAGRAGGELQARAEAVRRASGSTFVVVTDARGIRFTHPRRANIGRPVSTDPSGALDGRTVLAVETGTLGRSARAKVPLRAADGRVVGEVSVGILETRMRERLGELVPGLALYSGAALLVGALASLLLAARLKRRTFGLELDAIAGLLREREGMLHGLREGVVTVDEHLPELMLERSPALRERVVARVLAPLAEHPELERTLRALVAHDFDRAATAAALPVHRNTLGARVGRIEELCGLRVETTEGRALAWLAVLRP